jgi:hypothetical protein
MRSIGRRDKKRVGGFFITVAPLLEWCVLCKKFETMEIGGFYINF